MLSNLIFWRSFSVSEKVWNNLQRVALTHNLNMTVGPSIGAVQFLGRHLNRTESWRITSLNKRWRMTSPKMRQLSHVTGGPICSAFAERSLLTSVGWRSHGHQSQKSSIWPSLSKGSASPWPLWWPCLLVDKSTSLTEWARCWSERVLIWKLRVLTTNWVQPTTDLFKKFKSKG